MSEASRVPVLRKIQPIPLPEGFTPRDPGPAPRSREVKISDLRVDETYQRDFTARSVKLMQKMVVAFEWNKFKPIIVVEVGSLFHVIDGQHTATVVRTLAEKLDIKTISVSVVRASSTDERARAFVSHNSDRVVVPALNIYRALLAAGDPDAVDVSNVCRRAGVNIRALSQSSTPRPGETAAIGSIRLLVKRQGVMRARQALEILVKARRAPVSAAEIFAVEKLLFNTDPPANATRLTKLIRIAGDTGFLKAKARAAAERIPLWRALIIIWQRAK